MRTRLPDLELQTSRQRLRAAMAASRAHREPARRALGINWLLMAASAAGAAACVAKDASRPRALSDAPASREGYKNPILAGFYPDPSVCRRGEDYYLATSSFEYFPGVPIFHSRDLVHWRQIGHALTRPSQLSLAGIASSQGIFAPTLRYHAGKFYLITTKMPHGGHLIVTTQDPAGEWSEPLRLKEPAWGMDPSLFFDDDGRVYYTRHGNAEYGAIFQAELDLERGQLLGEARQIWSGTGAVWPEGPHLYKVGGRYYLMIAEGGTSYGHMESIARAASPWGPFEAYEHNPILSHRDRKDQPIQATGHADLVQAHDGSWWLVFLGIRPSDGQHHHLGRETFLAPVEWNAQGWPVVNGNRPIALRMDATPLSRASAAPAAVAARDEFDSDRLGLVWNFVRNPDPNSWSLTARRGFLRLNGSSVSLNDVASPSFVGRRQQHFRCRVSFSVDFQPQAANQEAGLTLRANETNHYDLVIVRSGSERVVRLRTRVKGVERTLAEQPLSAEPVVLGVEAYPDHYDFFCAPHGSAPRSLGTAPTAPLSSESAGGFTGVYFGLYAHAVQAKTTPPPPADFGWFEYLPLGD